MTPGRGTNSGAAQRNKLRCRRRQCRSGIWQRHRFERNNPHRRTQHANYTRRSPDPCTFGQRNVDWRWWKRGLGKQQQLEPETVPGSGDTASFNSSANGDTTINLGAAGRTINTILFSAAGNAHFTIGSGGIGRQDLTLNDGGAITVNSPSLLTISVSTQT